MGSSGPRAVQVLTNERFTSFLKQLDEDGTCQVTRVGDRIVEIRSGNGKYVILRAIRSTLADNKWVMSSTKGTIPQSYRGKTNDLPIAIDRNSPEGSPFALIGIAQNLAWLSGKTPRSVLLKLTAGDTCTLERNFEREFRGVVSLVN